MATDTIINFISPTDDVLDWIKTQVESATGVADVSIVEDEPEETIFNWLGKAERGQAVVRYEGSEYNNDGGARREMSFAVYFAWRATTDREGSQKSAFDVMEAITGKLDHEGDDDYLCYLKSDKPVRMVNSNMTVYKLTYGLEDY